MSASGPLVVILFAMVIFWLFCLQEKQGTVFTLIDSFNREKLGML